jgi:hypothetical protein
VISKSSKKGSLSTSQGSRLARIRTQKEVAEGFWWGTRSPLRIQ